MEIVVDRIRVVIDSVPIVHGANMDVRPGEFVGLIGPNGSGKSTLLRTIYRAIRPVAGGVRLGPG